MRRYFEPVQAYSGAYKLGEARCCRVIGAIMVAEGSPLDEGRLSSARTECFLDTRYCASVARLYILKMAVEAVNRLTIC